MNFDVSRWALDSAAVQGELAVMLIKGSITWPAAVYTFSEVPQTDDEMAVVYAKGAASAALLVLGRERTAREE